MVENELKIIHISDSNPSGKFFCFNFTKDTCYERLTYKCGLDLFKDERANKCVRLYNLMLDGQEFDMKIRLVEYQCGYYAIGDGKHRICIAGKMGLKVPIILIESDDVCECCKSDRTWFFMKSF